MAPYNENMLKFLWESKHYQWNQKIIGMEKMFSMNNKVNHIKGKRWRLTIPYDFQLLVLTFKTYLIINRIINRRRLDEANLTNGRN